MWDAAGIMKEYGCSDDGFIDFRAWLIAQGREVYFAALADPDSLADVVPYGDCCFEQLSYVGDYAYEQLTGKSAYDQTDWSLSLIHISFALFVYHSLVVLVIAFTGPFGYACVTKNEEVSENGNH